MDDQFGGRTDDDLFYDDFEPVDGQSQPIDTTASQPDPVPAAQPPTESIKPPAPVVAPAAAPVTQPPSSLPPHKSLAHSRFADKPAPAPKPAPTTASPAPAAPKQQDPEVSPPAAASSQDATPPANAPTAPKDKGARPGNTADPTARLGSGANPRQKLTDAELTAKMEKMKLVSAEKTRKFEMAEKDEKQHAAAYEKGMEEARKRRAEDAAKRRRGEEERRRMDDERAKNRERKLKAMNMKEGGWDEGKEALAEEEAKRGFRGANGGIRGTRSGGLSDSRYSRQSEEHDVDRFLDERHRGGGRGRGRGGRGGRGGVNRDGARNPSPATAKLQRQQDVPKTEDFPALPGAPAPAKSGSAADATPAPVEPLLPPLGGKWDDEMEALDALKESKS